MSLEVKLSIYGEPERQTGVRIIQFLFKFVYYTFLFFRGDFAFDGIPRVGYEFDLTNNDLYMIRKLYKIKEPYNIFKT